MGGFLTLNSISVMNLDLEHVEVRGQEKVGKHWEVTYPPPSMTSWAAKAVEVASRRGGFSSREGEDALLYSMQTSDSLSPRSRTFDLKGHRGAETLSGEVNPYIGKWCAEGTTFAVREVLSDGGVEEDLPAGLQNRRKAKAREAIWAKSGGVKGTGNGLFGKTLLAFGLHHPGHIGRTVVDVREEKRPKVFGRQSSKLTGHDTSEFTPHVNESTRGGLGHVYEALQWALSVALR
ncbi:hypothetical protein FA13DRAFT_1709160 [Coprinellus micaceus]|uniref:Uncharacterized protein n=1 Tax=Coprinellus micaceus TaxID=71717 RepID=A0A4Y7TDR8_COPMI|nr:hypothetical protein FA13DRAFT_1709160 [Coprinellus micaceus]